MSDDSRIDVVVTDGVDPNVDRKLRAIATSADKGATSVARLKAELASINATPVAKLQAATETSTATINKQLAAQGALQKETDASAATDLKATASKTKLTAAIDAEAAARARLALAVDKGLANSAAANAPSAAFAAGKNPFQAEADLAAASAAVGANAKTMEAAVAEAEVASVSKLGNIKLAALGAFDAVRDTLAYWGGSFKGFFGAGGASTIEKEAASVGTLGKAAGTNSVAIRELFVIGREASRGNFSRMAGSVSILAQSLGLLYTVLIPVTAVLAAAAAGMKLFQVSIQGDADKQLQAYSEHLGLTSKEMRKLGDESVGAQGKLKKFNDIKLTFGDVFHGLTKTISDTFNLEPKLKEMKNAVYSALTDTVKAFFEAAAELSGVMVAAYNGVKNVWAHFPAVMGDLFAQAVNKAAEIMEDMVNDAIGAVNKFAMGANKLIGINLFGQIGSVHIPRMTNQFAGAAASVGKSLTDGYKQGHDAAIAFDNDFIARWKKNSIDAGKSRLDALANAIKGNRNPKKETDPKTKADYLADENKKLDDQLARMHLLKDAREEQQALDQIEEAFAKRRQPLTEAEIDGFKKKIHAIQEYKYQQAEMDRIYEQFNGAQKIYNAGLAAADDLLSRNTITIKQHTLAVDEATRAMAAASDPTGASLPKFDYAVKLDQIATAQEQFILTNGKFGISQEQAAQQTVLATRAYQEAIDPLFAMKEQLTQATSATGLYGDAVNRNAYYQQIRNAELQKGVELSPNYVAGVNAEVDALMRQNDALTQQQYIQQQIGAIVNPILEDAKFLGSKQNLYAEIDRLRKTDVLNENQAAMAKAAVNAKYDEIRLRGASQFFGTLAQLSSSGNKKLAAIGKAAAVAQAVIDGILAAQKALASLPPPWSFATAAAVGVVTGANVAKILSTNVGSFRDGGDFIVQGNAGVDNNNINFNASRGERVTVQTPAQQREAARNSGGGNVSVPVKIINLQSKDEVLKHMASDEGERVILNVLSDNPSLIRNLAGASG